MDTNLNTNLNNVNLLQLKYIPLKKRGGYYQLIDYSNHIYFEGTGMETLNWLKKEGFKVAHPDNLPVGVPSMLSEWWYEKDLFT